MPALESSWHQEELRRTHVKLLIAHHDRDIANLGHRFAMLAGKKLEADLGKSLAYSTGLSNLLDVTRKDLEISSISLAQLDARNQSLSKTLESLDARRNSSGQNGVSTNQARPALPEPRDMALVEENQRLRLDLDKVRLSLADLSSLQAKYLSLQQELLHEREEQRKLSSTTVARSDMDDALRTVSDLKAQLTVSESRLDAFRNKLRLTKTELRQATSELTTFKENKSKQISVAFNEITTQSVSKEVPSFRESIAISNSRTGDEGIARPNSEMNGLGEKSFFSTTPFISRIGPAIESTANALGRFRATEISRRKMQQPQAATLDYEEQGGQEPSTSARRPLTALGGRAVPKLLQPTVLLRKDADGGEGYANDEPELPAKPLALKRKVLGSTNTAKNLFADDDVGQPWAKRLQGQGQGSGNGVKKTNFESKPASSRFVSAFQGQFSPLKRNRKVAAAAR